MRVAPVVSLAVLSWLVVLSWLALADPSAAQRACRPTAPDMLGPFYVPGAPERSVTGRGLVVTGTVRSAPGCAPVPGALLEWWAANLRGEYDAEHRATQRADDQGRFRYETDPPGVYPGRPPHLHLRVSASGHRTLITQIYPRRGQTAIDADLVLLPE